MLDFFMPYSVQDGRTLLNQHLSVMESRPQSPRPRPRPRPDHLRPEFLRSRWSRQIALSKTETFRVQERDQDQDFQSRDRRPRPAFRPGLETSITSTYTQGHGTRHAIITV